MIETQVLKETRQTVFLKGSPAKGLFGATLGFFTGFAAVALFGTTASKFQAVMGLSPMWVALLVAAPSLSGSLLRIPFSAWVDSTGGRKPFQILLATSIVGMAGLLVMISMLYPDRLSFQWYPLLLVLGLLSGCGIATFSVGISQVSYWFPQNKQGAALGMYAGIGNLAPGIFSILLPVALMFWGLAGSYLAWFLFLAAGTAVYFWTGVNAPYFQLLRSGHSPQNARDMARSEGQEMFPAGGLSAALLLSAKTWKTWALAAIYFATFGGFIALTAWLPTYWKGYFSMTPVWAGILTAFYSLLASLFRVWGGKIADRVGGEKTASCSLPLVFAGSCVMVLARSPILAAVGLGLSALGMGITNAAVFKLVPQEIPQAVGGASGWVGGIGALGGFGIPLFFGSFVSRSGHAGYASGFAVFVGLSALSYVSLLVLQRSRKIQKNIHGVK